MVPTFAKHLDARFGYRTPMADRGAVSTHIRAMSDRAKKAGSATGAQRADTSGAATQTVLHATCVALGETGILITGPSGSGKSDLALRLIDGGARLVADDLTALKVEAGALIALAPQHLARGAAAGLAGRLEVRGIGIVKVASVPRAALGLVVELAPSAEIARLPETETARYLGVALPRVSVDPFTASAAAKVRLAAAGTASQAP
jgi:serine kinase of HPr protein (carbohydrate metabolism regulator)